MGIGPFFRCFFYWWKHDHNMIIALLVDVIIPVLFLGGWEFSEMLEVKFVLKFFMKVLKREN